MARNRFPGKRLGSKVKVLLTCRGCREEKLKEFDAAISRMNETLGEGEKIAICGNMRTLLEHLEKGEVYYATPMAVPTVMENKPHETVTTIRTFLKGDERLWVLRHRENVPYVWKANYSSVGSSFLNFFIYSCDTVALL